MKLMKLSIRKKINLSKFFLFFLMLTLILTLSFKFINFKVYLENSIDSLNNKISNFGGRNDKLILEIESLKIKIDIQNKLLSDQKEQSNEQKIQSDKQDKKIKDLTNILSFVETVSKRTGLPSKAVLILLKNAKNSGIKLSNIIGLYDYESSFNIRAVNARSNATGLGQFLPSTAKWICNMNGIKYSYEKLKDPVFAINLTFMYLKYLSKKYNENFVMMLREYGDGTISYPSRVISRGNNYRDLDYRMKQVFK